jgi:hypothetical protein
VTTFENGTNGEGTVEVYFWFAWQNPSQDPAVLSSEADLVLQGTCKAVGNSHPFVSGGATLDLNAELVAYMGIDPISGPPIHIKYLTNDPPNTAAFSDTFHLPGPWAISVPGGSLVLFAVHFWIFYTVYNGSVSFDFESAGSIMCPSVEIDLRTPAPVAVAEGW